MGTIRVRDIAQKTLFQHELREQLQFGFWEDAMPIDHWQPWCEADVDVAGPNEPVGRDFDCVRDRYELTSRALLDQASGRMLTRVKIMLTFGEKLFPVISHLYGINGEWTGPPTDIGEYEDGIRAEIASILPSKETLQDVRRIIAMQNYTEQDLVNDLDDLRITMRRRLSSN
ncbi:MAG TPA: hypothetical protein VG714_07185 [Acidobacteriaceae bacterium]|nr:hypothetical protein [Acidobacteriaceae bacterium]